MARMLKAKRDKNFAETMRILKEPFSEKDIERAIKNYKSQVPQFNENAKNLNQQDVEGISKQIEKVLRERGVEMELNKDFIAKVEKELRDKQAKDAAERESRKNSLHIAGKDATRTMADDVVEGTDLVSKERVKSLNTDDSKRDISKSKGGSRRIAGGNLARTLDTMQRISDQAKAYNGGNEMYDFGNIMEKLSR